MRELYRSPTDMQIGRLSKEVRTYLAYGEKLGDTTLTGEERGKLERVRMEISGKFTPDHIEELSAFTRYINEEERQK